uniref:ZSWIM1/3 RNaseH-like domain-containing protein n=1 Tax=Amphimedon queenslandica TaxID=400682 RepID=A0A1X7TGY1_AMPQE
MKHAFTAYPELVRVHATYKLLELALPTYLLLCKHSNGRSKIIAVCLPVTEDAMTRMMENFKKHNVNLNKIRVIMVDKNIGERDV